MQLSSTGSAAIFMPSESKQSSVKGSDYTQKVVLLILHKGIFYHLQPRSVLPPISEHSGHLINDRNLQFMNACVQMYSYQILRC